MDWARDHPSWPLAELSRRIDQHPHRWHVQEAGQGETLLLLHGAGASTHSWRDLIPILAARYHVVALDLPGHGFTQITRKNRCSLPAMTDDILALCASQNWTPRAIVGHSAGVALALSLSTKLPPTRAGGQPAVIGINAALGRFEGVAGWLFPLLAKLLALNPLTAYMFAAGRNSTARAHRLITGTGSTLTSEGISYYARLISDRTHVDGALQMMAQWDIDDLLDTLADIQSECLFIVGDKDLAVKPQISDRAAAILPNARVEHLPAMGHLAHEETPQDVARIVIDWLSALPHSDETDQKR